MKYKTTIIKSESGVAILIVLALLAMLTGIAIMSVDRSNTDMKMSANQSNDEKAFYIAEAGLERAAEELNANNAWRGGYYKQVLEGGNYSVTVTDKSTNPALGDSIVLAATGVYWDGTALVEAWLVKGGRYPYRHAAFGDQRMFMQNNACTDSYNSDSGTYAATMDQENGDIGSNKKVDLQNLPVIGGDVSSATPGSISIVNSPTIMGDTTSKADPQPMDLVSDADYAWAQANNSAPSGFIGSGYSYSGGNLEIQNAKTVTLKSGTYYFNKLHLKNHAQLQVQAGAEVKIFMTGDFLLENLALINSNGKPAQLQIFTKGTKIEIQNNTEFKGTIYAPNCDFMHQNNALIYGSIIAKTVELKNNACIHYDRALSNLSFGAGGDYEKVAWRHLD